LNRDVFFYIERFKNQFLTNLLDNELIKIVYIYVNDEKIKLELGNIIDSCKKIYTNRLPLLEVRLQNISEEAKEIKQYIASDCGRKNGRMLNNNTAKELIQIWCNKISLLKSTYDLNEKENYYYMWSDFQKSKVPTAPTNLTYLENDNVICLPFAYPETKTPKRNFLGRSPIDARYIANIIYLHEKNIPSFHRHFFESAHEMGKLTNYFDEEIVLTYGNLNKKFEVVS